MTKHKTPHHRRSALHIAVSAAAALFTAGAAAVSLVTASAGNLVSLSSIDRDVVETLESRAEPVSGLEPGGESADLQAFGQMVGDAPVVSVGEATHSSAEFYTMQNRLFEYLVEEKNFTTFSREVSWSTGISLNNYVLHGRGDPEKILDNEVQAFYQVFDTEELLNLIEWMRDYNTSHENKVHFMGSDLGFPGPELFAEVDDHIAANHPDLTGTFAELYADLRPAPDMDLNTYMAHQQAKPVSEREKIFEDVAAARDLLSEQEPAGDPGAHAWAIQHATALAQTAEQYAFDTSTLEGATEAGRHRDRVMAQNIEWWNSHTDHKMMISHLTVHASYEPIDKAAAPETVAQHLGESMKDDFVTAGFTFNEGSFNTMNEASGEYEERGADPAPEGSNEHTLDQVSHDDYYMDLRDMPEPAREWLREPRSTYNIGGRLDPSEENAGQFPVALGSSYDIVIHLDEVSAANLRFQ